jgi:hypothetical protein
VDDPFHYILEELYDPVPRSSRASIMDGEAEIMATNELSMDSGKVPTMEGMDGLYDDLDGHLLGDEHVYPGMHSGTGEDMENIDMMGGMGGDKGGATSDASEPETLSMDSGDLPTMEGMDGLYDDLDGHLLGDEHVYPGMHSGTGEDMEGMGGDMGGKVEL